MVIFLFLLFTVFSLLSLCRLSKKNFDGFYISFYISLVLITVFVKDANNVSDYDNYLAMFYDICRNRNVSVEPSYVLIAKISNSIFHSAIGVFLIYASIGIALKFIAIRQLSPLAFLSLAIYISFFYILHELTQIRAGIASGFLLLCIKPLYDRDLRKFLILSVFACFFHYSALLILPLWFINPYKLNKYWIYSLPIAYVLAILNITPFSLLQNISFMTGDDRVNGYFIAMQNSEGVKFNIFNVAQLMRCTVCLYFIFNMSIIARNNSYTVLLIKIYLLGLCALPLLATIAVLSFRVSEFYSIVEIILYPLIIYSIKPIYCARLIPIFLGGIFLYLMIFHLELVK